MVPDTQVADLKDVVPGDKASSQRTDQVGLLVENNLFFGIDDHKRRALYNFIVQFPALTELLVAAQIRDDVHPGLQPLSMNNRIVGIRRSDENVTSSGAIARVIYSRRLHI